MATVTLDPVAQSRDGVDLTVAMETVDPADTYEFLNDGRTVLIVDNGTGDDCVATIVTPNTKDGNAIADKAVTMATAKTWSLGPYLPSVYNNSNGKVTVTFDKAVDVVAVRQ